MQSSGSGSGRELEAGLSGPTARPPCVSFVERGKTEREGSWSWTSHRLLPYPRALTIRSNTAVNSLETFSYRGFLRAVRGCA